MRDLSTADIEYTALPVPAFPEHTVRIPAGTVTFGVEYRHLDEDMVMAFYGPDARDKFDGKRPAGMAAVVDEDGLSIHVFDTATGHEALRFDCFDDAPHFHLLHPPTSRNRLYNHDAGTDGRLVDWALAEMRVGLRPMVAESGATDAAVGLDEAEVAAALDVVEQVARYVEAAGRPIRVDIS